MNLFRFFQPAASAPIARERLQILLGADLGGLVVGLKGKQTRLELAEENLSAFINGADATSQWTDDVDDGSGAEESPTRNHGGSKPRVPSRCNRVFITRRMKQKILEQVKELVAFGKFAPVVARDRESAKPSPHDVMDEMRRCDTAVIHVGADGLRFDGACNEEPRHQRRRSDRDRSGDGAVRTQFHSASRRRRHAASEPAGALRVPLQRRRIGHAGYDDAVQAFNDFTRLRPTRPLVFAPKIVGMGDRVRPTP
jgi:hypothetical protein